MKVVVLCGIGAPGSGKRPVSGRSRCFHRQPAHPVAHRRRSTPRTGTRTSSCASAKGRRSSRIRSGTSTGMVSDVKVKIGEPGRATFYTPVEEKGWSVTLADTGLDAMTGGRIKRIEKYLRGRRGIPADLRRRGRKRRHRRLDRAAPGERAHPDPHRRPPARPLGRTEACPTAWSPLSSKAADIRRARKRRLLRREPPPVRLSERRARSGFRAGTAQCPVARAAARVLCPRRFLAADGHVRGVCAAEPPLGRRAGGWKIW